MSIRFYLVPCVYSQYQCRPRWLISNDVKWCSQHLVKTLDVLDVNYPMCSTHWLVGFRVRVTQTNLFLCSPSHCIKLNGYITLHIAWWYVTLHLTRQLIHTAHAWWNTQCTKLGRNNPIMYCWYFWLRIASIRVCAIVYIVGHP